MISTIFQLKRQNFANLFRFLLVGVFLAFVFLLSFLVTSFVINRNDGRIISGVVSTEDGNPINGAIIRVQTTSIQTISDEEGNFKLSIPKNMEEISLTAWAKGFFNGGPVEVRQVRKKVNIQLQAHNDQDNPDYEWLSATGQTGEGEDQGCAKCHSSADSKLSFSLPVDQWLLDVHAKSSVNQRFLTMYLGTDVNGNQSPTTDYVNMKDYGTEPIRPVRSQQYYGPGYKLDFPETSGNCATCHTPLSAINAPYNADPTHLEGVETEGISCDFCHKIWDIKLDPDSGLPYQNMTGVQAYEFRRPHDGEQFFAGPLDDVAPGEDTYSPLQSESQFCAGCHYGVFWDTVIYDSFGEWLRSPYSDPENQRTCQDCHMPRLGDSQFALTDQGGRTRDPATIFSHTMPGASDNNLLQNSVRMDVSYTIAEDSIQIQVKLVNDLTGHYVPTDSPLRHLILLVNATNPEGLPYQQTSGPQLPDWCGVGEVQEGAYAGEAGMVYAKVLAEQWTNTSPTAAYWNPTYLVSDNRLAPFEEDITNYEFQINPDAPVNIHVKLIYRRAFFGLMKQKGWQVPDILMEEEVMEIDPQVN